MATRKTRLITKNSSNANQALPSSSDILKGEAIVNLYDGIMFYSGTPGSTSFVNLSGTTGYFEVGSNVNVLKIRDKIVSYSGVTNLSGKFLSGTSSGFVLSEISQIGGISDFDYYPNANTFVITSSNGGTFSATVESVTGLTVNGNLTVTGNTTLAAITGDSLNITGNTNLSNFTGGSATINGTLNVTGDTTLASITGNNLNITGNTIVSSLTGGSTTINGTLNVTGDTTLAAITGNSLNITGNTNLNNFTGGSATINGTLNVTGNTTLAAITGNSLNITGDTIVSSLTGGSTTINGTLTVTGNTTLAAITGNSLNITGDTIVSSLTGGSTTINGTLNVTGNTVLSSFTGGTGLINGNLTVTGNTNISGNTTINGTTTLNGNVSISGFSPNLVVYTDGSGNLKTKAGFSYLEGTDLLTVKNLTVNNTGQTANFGTGGVVIGSGGSLTGTGNGDLVVHGSLTVFGDSISAFTSNLYIEDNNIILNYNPTGSTDSSSVNSGFQIQDGNGLPGGNTNFEIIRMINFTGNTGQAPVTSEYTGSTGNDQRGWITQLNDIVIRSTNIVDDGITDVKGVRVLAEFDTLDGGTY